VQALDLSELPQLPVNDHKRLILVRKAKLDLDHRALKEEKVILKQLPKIISMFPINILQIKYLQLEED
jgi:hypothetical protein